MTTPPNTISLTEKYEQWIKSRIESGEFGNASEYIHDLIRRDQERHTKIEAIRLALIEGEESGPGDRSPHEIVQAVRERRDGKL